MEQKLDCAIVRDLLPSYADGLTSEATNKAVREHLAGCADCAAALRRMKEPEPDTRADAPEVDYLKKVRRRSTGRSIVLSVILILIGVAALSYRFFYVGSAAAAGDASCHAEVSGDTVTVTGTLTGSGLGVSRVVFSDSAGMVSVTVYTAPKTFFNSGDFSASYTAGCGVTRVSCSGLVVWEEGADISSTAARLFAGKNPFVGDMSANSRIAEILGVSDRFGPFTNELQTDSEPYGWTLLTEDVIASDGEAAARALMEADSCVMLAAIDNLGYVTWRYSTEDGAREFTVTAQDATDIAGSDIKAFADSASGLQTLLQLLRLK